MERKLAAAAAVFLNLLSFGFFNCPQIQAQTAAAAPPPPGFGVKVKFGEVANLTYQLDCVSGLPVHCSAGNLGDLWKREFLKTEEDRRTLREWRRLRERYSQGVRLDKTPGAHLNLFDKIRIAGFQASGVGDYAERLDLLTAPPDRRSFERVVRHFLPRFGAWWRSGPAAAGDEFARQTDLLLRSPEVSALLRRFYDFYAPSLPDRYEVSFNLLYVPDAVRESTSGQQLQNYSLMEFKPKERPAQRIDVAVHELCHFFYDNLPPENQAKLQKSFREGAGAASAPAYNLLNEALASAFGNGMIARAVTPPAEFEKYLAARGSFYNNEAIDRAAKTVLPWLDAWLARGRTINDPQFAPEYISLLEKAFGEDLLRPKLYLSEMFLFVDEKYGSGGSLRRRARGALETASLYASEGSLGGESALDAYSSQPHLNSVFIVHPDNLAELARRKIISGEQAKEIRAEFDRTRAVLYAARRAPFTYIYVIAAEDAEGAGRLLERLAGARQFQGVYRALDE